MDLHSGTFYWPTTFPDTPSYPALESDIECDVVIVGGGSSGAQCAFYLAGTGLDVVLVEKARIGGGTTSATSALIQYAGETMYTELVGRFGKEYIRRHLGLMKDAIDDIEQAARAAAIDSEFSRRDTLYAASSADDVGRLSAEYGLLKEFGFDVEFWRKAEIQEQFGFNREAAIYSFNDGELNPFRFTHALIDYAAGKGMRVFEETSVVGCEFEVGGSKEDARGDLAGGGSDAELGSVVLRTSAGYTIKARRPIFSTGYEGLDIKAEQKASISSTYVVTTNRIGGLTPMLLWETAQPFLFLRTTADGRFVIGGHDVDTADASERDEKLHEKRDMLMAELGKLFPDIEAEAEYCVGAFFASVSDGLPIVGVYDEYPGSYFLFAFGDNGMVYGQLLAKLIVRDIVEGGCADLGLYLRERPLIGRI
ncbi:NAD(P)/FAD-dependent oxidoreductase [Bacillus sp. EB01]|uniref:NAD(P)/FAD-dependent oxidoreductase n=1 Tax=Bacillus sp. EB01 TaxID=1347086 RepID=UPI0005C6E6B1|nr:FAD-dependent oxidoreductase [Bacillus sp. EB01]